MLANLIAKANSFIEQYNEELKAQEIDEFKEKISLIRNEKFDYVVEEIIANYDNVIDFPLPYFTFIDEISDTKKYLVFGYNPMHNFYYAIDKKTKEVLAIDDDGKKIYSCSQNELSFFKTLIECLDLEIMYLKKDSKALSDDYRRQVFEGCLLVAGGNKYSAFYQLVLAIGR